VKVSFSPAAQADLLDIAAFIAQDKPARALTFVAVRQT
jgi:plasmid stabilization system protein ParE